MGYGSDHAISRARKIVFCEYKVGFVLMIIRHEAVDSLKVHAVLDLSANAVHHLNGPEGVTSEYGQLFQNLCNFTRATVRANFALSTRRCVPHPEQEDTSRFFSDNTNIKTFLSIGRRRRRRNQTNKSLGAHFARSGSLQLRAQGLCLTGALTLVIEEQAMFPLL